MSKTLEIKGAKILTASNGAIFVEENKTSIYPDKVKIAADISQQVKAAIEQSTGETTINIFIGVNERKKRESKITQVSPEFVTVSAVNATMEATGTAGTVLPKGKKP